MVMAETVVELLAKRVRDLEESQAKLQQQLLSISSSSQPSTSSSTPARRGRSSAPAGRRHEEEYQEEDGIRHNDRFKITGYFSGGRPYRRVLEQLGHALFVHRNYTSQIIFWNKAAENLYGWTSFEALGRRIPDLLMDEGSRMLQQAEEKLQSCGLWSGQIPSRTKSGDIFMAVVTKSLLYEDDKLIGVITVSSDAARFYDKSEQLEERHGQQHGESRYHHENIKRIQWHPQPQIRTSVSTLVSKVLHLSQASSDNDSESTKELDDHKLENKHEQDGKVGTSATTAIFKLHEKIRSMDKRTNKSDDLFSKLNQQSKFAAKVFSKFQNHGCSECDQVSG